MLGRLLNHFKGFERLKHRGHAFFIGGEFERAHAEYRKARSILGREDFRLASVEALMKECERRLLSAPGFRELDEASELPAPEVDQLFELAIADKPRDRAELYRSIGSDFREGYLALVQGDASVAARRLGEVEARSSSSGVVFLELGRAQSLDGQMEEARSSLKHAERLLRGDAEVVLMLAAVNIELGRFEEAQEPLAALAGREEQGSDPEVTFLLGLALAGAGRTDAALERFRQTVKLEPRFHEAYFEGARLVIEAGDSEAAFELLNRACGLAPDEVRYNRELVELVMRYELDAETGLAACDRLMVTDEDNSWQYLHWIAELYLRRGWKKEARDPLQKALALVPLELTNERIVIEQRLRELSL